MKRLALTAALLAGFVVVPAVPAQASACAGTDGVTVIVDFGAFGGGVSVQCASGTPPTGLEALHQAGFSTTGTSDDGTAFVCRINNKPGPEAEPCVNTPAPARSWSYWHAERGGSWVYSKTGAAGYKPPPGSVEGWAFGSRAMPSVAPPAAPAPPAPATTAAQPARTTPAATPADSPGAEPSAVDTPSPTAVAASPLPSVDTSSPAEAAIPLLRNNFTGTAVTIGIVLAIAAAATVITLRRRRHENES